MTEQEANVFTIAYRDCKEVADTIDVNEEFGKASTILFYMDEILDALKQVSEYHAVGTVEEFKALKEKSEPYKVIEHETPHFVHWQCGNCGAELYSGQAFCDDCGHPTEWEKLLE